LIEKQEREKKRRAGLDGTSRGRAAAGIDAVGAAMASVITLKPATCGHFKTGHFGWPET
jgi:hypothetical protein